MTYDEATGPRDPRPRIPRTMVEPGVWVSGTPVSMQTSRSPYPEPMPKTGSVAQTEARPGVWWDEEAERRTGLRSMRWDWA